MTEKTISRSRVRVKGQLTVPPEIRNILGVEEGDELVFRVDESGRVFIERMQIIPPEQSWFWSERWQRLEKEVQNDIDNNNLHRFDSTEEALDFLSMVGGGEDAENSPI